MKKTINRIIGINNIESITYDGEQIDINLKKMGMYISSAQIDLLKKELKLDNFTLSTYGTGGIAILLL